MANRWGEGVESVTDFIYFLFNTLSIFVMKSRDITLPTKVNRQSYGFSSGHVGMWERDCEESWVPKNWCFWTVVLEKTLESPVDCKDIKLVNPKGNQHWIFIGRTDAEAEAPILWPPNVKSWFIKKKKKERPWCWERLKAGGEGDDRRWDGWMASLTQWTWVWARTTTVMMTFQVACRWLPGGMQEPGWGLRCKKKRWGNMVGILSVVLGPPWKVLSGWLWSTK